MPKPTPERSKLPLPEPSAIDFAPRPQPAPDRRHRGGAWKVAYADFVTALMALFIVLWMMNASSKVRQSVSGYFRDPRGYTRQLGAGPANAGESLRVQKDNVNRIREQVQQALERAPEFEKMRNNVKFSVTGEGLRIDLLENAQGMFFVSGSPVPTEAGAQLLSALAQEIGKMPNTVVIEGHTDALAYRNSEPSSGYGNWDLSTERANAARRLLASDGLRPQQIVELRGYADQKLMLPDAPNDPRNRRVSLVVKFTGE
jgi:chemotaxis protein MotB